MSLHIKNNVYWVGKIDFELRNFHGEELTTHNGSTYNSYLIKDEKNVLIDSVYYPFAEEYINELEKEIDLNKIDYIVINHAEPDHSGALPMLMERIPNAQIYCSSNGVKSIKGYYHKDWNFNVMKTGDRLSLGSRDLIFIENSMIHWPDSMMCYLEKDNILFSNDAFGQHFASDKMFNSNCDKCTLYSEAIKYYANIVSPFSKKVVKKLEELRALNLPIDYILPSHGIMWDENPRQILELYEKWADNYSENQVTIFYDSMYSSTRKMAEAIAKGIAIVNNKVEIKIHNASKSDKSDIITDIFKSKIVLAGSSTVNNGILTSVAGILDELVGFALPGKKAAAFGSYGWSPLGTKIINTKLTEAGMEILSEPMKVQWNPDNAALESCTDYGKKIAEAIM